MEPATLPQPPPEAPAPPPSPPDAPSPPEKLKPKRRRLAVRVLIGFGLAIAMLAAIHPPMIFRQRKKADLNLATNNARSLGLALLEFESDYGEFPDEATTGILMRGTGTAWNWSYDSSNDFLRQLFAAGITQSEEMFSAPIKNSVRPDNVMNTTDRALGAGECGFSYIYTPGANSRGPADRPLLVTPLIGKSQRFDKDPFDAQAVVLFTNGTVQRLKIEEDGRVFMYGKDLFDPSQPYWEGKPFEVKWPIPKKP